MCIARKIKSVYRRVSDEVLQIVKTFTLRFLFPFLLRPTENTLKSCGFQFYARHIYTHTAHICHV